MGSISGNAAAVGHPKEPQKGGRVAAPTINDVSTIIRKLLSTESTSLKINE